MIRVYIAGAITATGAEHPTIGFLTNIRNGIRTTVEVLLKGYAPFCPFIDYQYWLLLRGEEKITPETILQISCEFLRVSNAVLIVPGWENSYGTKQEIELASSLSIPVFYNLGELEAYFDRKKFQGKNEWFKIKTEGAEHYKNAEGIQPIDLYQSVGILQDWVIGEIMQHAVRNRTELKKKINPIDFKKIIHYCKILLADFQDEEEKCGR